MERKIIRLSVADATSPLCWPIAFHEFGHAIDDHHKFSKKSGLSKGKSLVDRITRSYYQEFFADAVAARTVGPSMLLALLRLEAITITSGLTPAPSITHPSVSARIAAVSNLLPKDAMKPFDAMLTEAHWLSERLLASANVPANDRQGFAALEAISPPIAALAATAAQKVQLKAYGASSLSRSLRLADRLRRGLPPAAIRRVDKATTRPEIENAIATRNKVEFAHSVGRLAEEPATPGEVFVAGFLRLEEDLPGLVDGVLSTAYPGDWGDWVKPIHQFFQNDELLVAALHAVDIHQFLVDKAEKAGDSLHEPATAGLAPNATKTTTVIEERSGLLSDSMIAMRLVHKDDSKRLYVTPLIDPRTQVGPASLDIRLGTDALVFSNMNFVALDPLLESPAADELIARYTRTFEIAPDEPLVLHPGEFALAASLEYVRIPPDLACRLEGRDHRLQQFVGRDAALIVRPRQQGAMGDRDLVCRNPHRFPE